MKLTIDVISAPHGLIDHQDLPLELLGAAPTLGELRNEAKRKLEAEDLIIQHDSAVLGVGEDATHLQQYGIEDGRWIIVVVKRTKRAESPGAPGTAAVPWAPPPAAAAPSAVTPGAQPKTPDNLFGCDVKWRKMQELEL